jgi:DNA-binding SARP family transcriptional activator/TolB-like protein
MVARCLGAFRLEDAAGNELQFRTRKARAILAILALNGRPMSRNALADLLWSDRGPTQARASLRQTIFELQHLDWRGEPLLAAGRDDVAAGSDALVTDLQLIRTASASGDWPRLLTLLESSDSGLLSDLDGLDPELDDWLRLQRAHEPGKTIAAAVEAAERCAAEAGPRAALDLTGEILRLDPANEEATRLAMRLADETGDRVALHRHFAALRDRLRADYDAEPSPETLALLRELGNGSGEPLPRDTRPAAEPHPQREREQRSPARLDLLALAAALLVLSVAVVVWLWPRDARPAAEHRGVVVAVLPFEQQPADGSFLAAGLWEQTRAALARNPSIRVLGPATIDAVARGNLTPQDYRKRFGVTHLLEGIVRRNGSQLMISVSLTQTSDGVAVWEDSFEGRMGEPFEIQDAVANGIEGRLRAQLAPGGGRRAEEIATSPEVYALYSQARQLVASRHFPGPQRAEALLRQAIKVDQNYAPAWALLGEAIYFNSHGAVDDTSRRAEALAAVQHAMALAPQLASAHATYALVQGEQSEEAEAQLRKAVALDPSYSDAWTWLGNSLSGQSRLKEAKAAYEHAVAIDPLSPAAVHNLSGVDLDLGDQPAFDSLIRTISLAGASPEAIDSLRVEQAYARGDFSGSIALLRAYPFEGGRPNQALWDGWFETLTALGYYDKLHAITGCPDWYAPLISGKALPPTTVENRPVSPEEFWTSMFFSAPASRAMVRLGHSRDLVALYRAGFRDSDDFISRTSRLNMLGELAPNLAIALQQTGSQREAAYLLSATSMRLEDVLKHAARAETTGYLAFIRAAQGDSPHAVALLDLAVRRGWFPDGRAVALDLAQEPAFRNLRGDPKFELLRKRILDHVARERAELGPLTV